MYIYHNNLTIFILRVTSLNKIDSWKEFKRLIFILQNQLNMTSMYPFGKWLFILDIGFLDLKLNFIRTRIMPGPDKFVGV